MSRNEFFLLLSLLAISLVTYFSAIEYRRTHKPRKFLKRFLVLSGLYVGVLGIGLLSLILCREWFAPSFMQRNLSGFAPTLPVGLPPMALTALLAGAVVLVLYQRLEKVSARARALSRKLLLSERARTQLLKELAHDVRSPLSTLHLIVENLRSGKVRKAELAKRAATAEAELEYLQKLVDSLLLLAQMEDPDFGRDATSVDLGEILWEQVGHFEGSPRELDWDYQGPGKGECFVRGNRVLVDRIVRNALENASQHARSRVEVRVSSVSGSIEILIRDDGDGFSDEARARFGGAKSVAVVNPGQPASESIGLGSRVIRAAVERIKGSVAVGNWMGSRGGELRILIPQNTNPRTNQPPGESAREVKRAS